MHVTHICIATKLIFIGTALIPVLKCHVMLQKERGYDELPIDEECGNGVESGHAGLCL